MRAWWKQMQLSYNSVICSSNGSFMCREYQKWRIKNHRVLTSGLKSQIQRLCQTKGLYSAFEPHRHKHWKMHTRQVKTCEKYSKKKLFWVKFPSEKRQLAWSLVIRKRPRHCMKCRCVSLTQVILGFIGSALPLKGPWPLEILYCKNSEASEASLAGRRRSRASI